MADDKPKTPIDKAVERAEGICRANVALISRNPNPEYQRLIADYAVVILTCFSSIEEMNTETRLYFHRRGSDAFETKAMEESIKLAETLWDQKDFVDGTESLS